ncbi:unnamed protein product [Moneuplotes crassus]|uniref:Uncharacterized protein n=1 Tax=Euplotes crassus TaxID=5936 RepID=A0AAD1UEU8_EUPCR|nr:unnamed protein product [Moneuplotes crassus]
MINNINSNDEENLSEDFLSEGAFTCEVKINKKLNINMKMSSFNKTKHHKLSGDDLAPQEPLFWNEKSLFKEGCQDDKNSTNSFTIEKRGSSRKISEDTVYQKSPKRISMRSQISDLLKKSAQLREERKLILKKKQSVMDAPLESLEILNKHCEQTDFLTFGS